MNDMKLIAQLLRGIRDSEMGKKFNGLDLLPKYKNESGGYHYTNGGIEVVVCACVETAKSGVCCGISCG